jgi:hypothetical protein
MKKFLLFIAWVILQPTTMLSQGCLPEGITFTTQEQIDNFQANYPGCVEIEGGVIIGDWMSGSDITNLNGLSDLTSIGDGLQIGNNPALTNLTGLDNLHNIGGDFWIYWNHALANLTGLDNLISIGGLLGIDDNNALVNLTGLYNLSTIGSDLIITNHNALTSLTGLENIQANSIDSLYISNNNVLFECDFQSICDYLASPNGTVEIYNNAPGCNNPEEVEEACLISVGETDVENQISLFPNPADKTISIVVTGGPEIQEVSISNHLGQVVLRGKPVNNFLDVSALQPGIYFIGIISDQTKTIQKLIIQ